MSSGSACTAGPCGADRRAEPERGVADVLGPVVQLHAGGVAELGVTPAAERTEPDAASGTAASRTWWSAAAKASPELQVAEPS